MIRKSTLLSENKKLKKMLFIWESIGTDFVSFLMPDLWEQFINVIQMPPKSRVVFTTSDTFPAYLGMD